MKKVVRLVIVLAAFMMVLASCTQHLCPAYTNNDTQSEENVKG